MHEQPATLSEAPFRRQEGAWPTGPEVRFGWTLQSAAQSRMAVAEAAFRLAERYERIPVCLTQVHRAALHLIEPGMQPALEDPPRADGILTGRSDLLLCVSVADCAPVFLRFPGGIGLLHAGWRGIAAGILPLALETIRSRFGAEPGRVEALLGPSILVCCFEVSASVAALFGESARRRHGARLTVDLPGVLLGQWLAAGGAPEHFHYRHRCTVCGAPAMYSHRRAPGEGRNFAYLYRLDS